MDLSDSGSRGGTRPPSDDAESPTLEMGKAIQSVPHKMAKRKAPSSVLAPKRW